MPDRVPDVVFGPDELMLMQSVYDALLERIAWERVVCEDDRLHVAHVVFEYGKLGILEPADLTAHAIAELQQHTSAQR
jgi:hypothetical protein